MPYKLEKQGEQYCVINTDTKRNKGCSPSRDMAVKHMRLLYGVENGSIKAMSTDMPDEQECMCDACVANTIADSAAEEASENQTKAVWNAKYVNALPDSAFGYIEPDCKGNYCRHFPIKDSQGNYDQAHVANALARAGQSPFGSKAMSKIEAGARALKMEGHKEKDNIQAIIDAIKSVFSSKQDAGQAVSLTKQQDGRTRVMMRMSNMFKDRHGEIITQAAHKEYEAYVEGSKDYPEFWLWHTPGTRWGKADLVSFDDGFLTVSGLVDQGKEYIAEALAIQKDIGVSHGFKGISLGEGTIDYYRSFEASPLPRQEAANLWTGLMLAKEWEMGLADKHKKFFSNLGIPETVITGWDQQNKDIGTILKDAGIEYKDIGDAEPATPAVSMVEITLPDGSKAQVAEASIVKQPIVDEVKGISQDTVLNEILSVVKSMNGRLEAVETKTKEIETKSVDAVASTLEAAIVSGKGFVASKEGSAPDKSVVDEHKEWEQELAQLIAGSN